MASYWEYKRRRVAQNIFDYRSLIQSPHDLDNTDLSLPANAVLAFSTTKSVSAGDVSLTVGSTQYFCPALDADELYRVSWQEENEVVSATFHSGDPGEMNVYVLDEWRRASLIANFRNTVPAASNLIWAMQELTWDSNNLTWRT